MASYDTIANLADYLRHNRTEVEGKPFPEVRRRVAEAVPGRLGPRTLKSIMQRLDIPVLDGRKAASSGEQFPELNDEAPLEWKVLDRFPKG